MGKIKSSFTLFFILILLMSCGDEAKENAEFTGPFAQCPPSPTQGFSDPICCTASKIDNGVNLAMRLAGINFPIPLSLGELVASKNPEIEKVCGQNPTGAITEGLERINDSVERAQEGTYNASRLLCESKGTCDSEAGLDTKKETKLPQVLSKAITTDKGTSSNEGGSGLNIPSITVGGSGSGNGGGGARSAGGGSGGLGFKTPSKKDSENKNTSAANEPYMPDLNNSGGKYSAGGSKKRGGGKDGQNEDAKSKNPFGDMMGSKKGSGEDANRNLSTLQFGDANADDASAMGSPDPSDYFSRTDAYSNLFKIVEKKYRQTQMHWKIKESEGY